MRRAAIGAIVSLLAVDSASACHKYSRWYYPWRQSCRVTALAPRSTLRLPQRRILISIKETPPQRVATPPPEIPIPSLADIDWGRLADDEARGKILLRVILQGKEDK